MMTEREIQFFAMEEMIKFSRICSKMDYDVDLRYKKSRIDAKSILGLLSIDLGEKVKLVVHGQGEEIDRYFREFYA